MCREARARPFGVADGVVLPMKSGNADGGKDPWSGNSVVRRKRQEIDDESGNSIKSWETPAGATCESEGRTRVSLLSTLARGGVGNIKFPVSPNKESSVHKGRYAN